jgi:uncharacterized protein (TIGR02757 family)
MERMPGSMKTTDYTELKTTLDRLYEDFDFEMHVRHDPIEFPHRYRSKKDREVVAFLSALFAYGRVDLFKPVLEKNIFHPMGKSPCDFVLNFDRRNQGRRFDDFRYRFNTGEDVVLLFQALKAVLRRYGSLERLFNVHYHSSHVNIRPALDGFIHSLLEEAGREGTVGAGFLHLLPSPAKGSTCKRLNMFLRWMVRDRDVDLGLWRGIPASKLIIPLDTHIARISRCLRLTQRKSDDWKTAEDITENLKKLDPGDPVKYDFALSHQGISGLCKADKSTCVCCQLR